MILVLERMEKVQSGQQKFV